MSGNKQDFLSEFPGFEQSLAAFGGIFDNVDHVTEINNIGWNVGIVRLVVRVPASASVALLRKAIEVTTMTSAVIKKCCIFV